jgi:tetratricopeptide (TPR) repeat protein
MRDTRLINESDPLENSEHSDRNTSVTPVESRALDAHEMDNLAPWVLTGQLQAGNFDNARRLVHRALKSNIDRKTIAQVLLANAYMQYGRASILAEQPDRGVRQLTESQNLGMPGESALFLDLLVAEAERYSRIGDHRESIQRWQDIASLLNENTPEYVYRSLSEEYSLNKAGFGGTKEENRVWGDIHKHDVLAHIHETLKPELYLEIGVDLGKSLARAKGPAIGVDPRGDKDVQVELNSETSIYEMSSDEFFRSHAEDALRPRPDLVFIDGMHLFEFALRDFMNVERFSNPWTLVVFDDIFPCNPVQAKRRRQSESWTGDVWKVKNILEEKRPDIALFPLSSASTGLLLVAGLDAHNDVLRKEYERILDTYSKIEKVPKSVLYRHGAIPSDNRIIEKLVERLFKAKNSYSSVKDIQATLRTVKNDSKL